MKCILHFGMQKTGSTSIQSTLYSAELGPEFGYIHFGQPNSSMYLGTAFLESPEKFYANRRRGLPPGEVQRRRDDYRRALHQQLREAGNRTSDRAMILSSEDLPNMSEQVLAEMRDFIAQVSPDIRPVGYIRAPKSYIESSLQERIKHGRSRFDLDAIFPKYRERFEKFDHVFGKENVSFWPFAPRTFTAGDVVLDFCRRIGLPLAAADVRRVNEGLTLPAVRLLYAYRVFGRSYGAGQEAVKANALLLNALQALPGEKLRLSDSLINPLLNKYRSDVAWMEERLGCSLAESADDKPGAITCEKDLLNFDDQSLDWLAGRLAMFDHARRVSFSTPEEVADGMAALVDQLMLNNAVGAGQERQSYSNMLTHVGVINMKVKELAKRAKADAGAELAGVSDAKAAKLLRAAFNCLREDLTQLDAGTLRVVGLGTYRAKRNDVLEDATGQSIKRFVFVPYSEQSPESDD